MQCNAKQRREAVDASRNTQSCKPCRSEPTKVRLLPIWRCELLASPQINFGTRKLIGYRPAGSVAGMAAITPLSVGQLS